MKQLLTPKERTVFDCLVQHKADHDGNSPTVREIMVGVEFLHSTSTVRYYLDRLHDKGWIVNQYDGRSRNLVIVGGRWSYETGGVNSLTKAQV